VHERNLRALAALFDRAQLNVPPLSVVDFHVAAKFKAGAVPLGEEGAALALERIQIEMQVDRIDHPIAAIAPGEFFAAVDGMLDRVECGLNCVADHAIRERRLFPGARSAPGIRRARRDNPCRVA
jgi:hypothetical protein